MKKFNRKFKNLLKKMKKLLKASDYALLTKSLFNNLFYNLKILQNPELEYSKAIRGYIYSVDFGYTIGSVLRDRHYCVVLNTQGKTSVVVPLTSKAPKNDTILKINLGVIPNLSSKPNINSYALVNQITTVSRSMLMTPRIKNKLYHIKLNAQQLDLVEKGLENILFFKKKIEKDEKV